MRGGTPDERMDKIREALPPQLKSNPFFDIHEETHFIPAWDRIKLKHILPAMEYAMEMAEKNIDAIRDNKAAPTFANTVEALETAGALAAYFAGVMNCIPPGADPKPYEEIQEQVYTKYMDLWTRKFTDKVLYEKFQTFIASPAYKKLSVERKGLCDMYAETFRVCGVKLSDEKQEEIRKLEKKITALSLKSQANMRNANAAYTMYIYDKAPLKGLSAFALDAAAEKAKKKGHPKAWAFGLDREGYAAFMQSADNRELRHKLWLAQSTQAAQGRYDNRETILELTALQQEVAHLKGYRNVAQETLAYQMAGNSREVARFLNGLRKAAKPVATQELETLRTFARQRDGIKELKPWDVAYYQERLKHAALGYDEESLRPYFELESVLKGLFQHMGKVFGVKIEETHDYPVYNPDVRAFNVVNARSGKHMGVVFMDLYDRNDKPAGTAWDAAVMSPGLFMGSVQRPVDMIVTKFVRGAGKEPTLLLHDNVLTIFHEMGHAMHNMVSKCRYQSFGGTNVKWDFVEFPSQMQENFAWQPDILRTFARHYKTGEPMPEEMLNKVHDSRKFMAGMGTLGYAMKSWLDLSWYRTKSENITSVEDFEKTALAGFRISHGASTPVLSPSFSHLFGGGYESCYYSYQWAQVMEADVFSMFEKKGLYNRSLCAAFKHALEKGGSVEPGPLFRSIRHRSPRQANFLDRQGLKKIFDYSAALAAPEAANDNASKAQPASVKNHPARAPKHSL